jgi:hypothetical protein
MDCALRYGEGESIMKILGKQSLTVPSLRCRGAASAFRSFPERMREISGNTRYGGRIRPKFMDTHRLRISR